MKTIFNFKAMEIIGETNVNLELNQKMLKVIGTANLIKEVEKRILIHDKRAKQWVSLGLSILSDVNRLQLYIKMLKRLKKYYYNSLESLQLQVEKEKHTAGYFK